MQGVAGRRVTGGKPVISETATLNRLSGGRLHRAGDALLRLQRLQGNHYVQRLVGHLRRQRDKDDVMAGEQVRSVLRSGGARLDPSFRDRAESFLGADLSQVRVHTGAAAAESARAVQAHAYTSGVHVVFGQGMYDTRSTAGQNRLVHELTHVVQQQRGAVAGINSAGGLSLSDPSDRFEREASRSGTAFASAATQQFEERGMYRMYRGGMDRETPAPQRCAGIAFRSASAPVPIQRFKIPSGGASFSSGAYGEGYLYMKGTPKLSLQPRSGGSGGYDVVESHVTVFPRSKGSDQADNFHVTFVLTSNDGKAGAGLARKQEEAEKVAKAKEEATKAAHLKGSLAERTSARFDTSGGAWRRGGGISVSKDISIHFHGDEKGLYRNDFEAKFGRRSDFHTLGNYRKLYGAAESIAESFIDKYLK